MVLKPSTSIVEREAFLNLGCGNGTDPFVTRFNEIDKSQKTLHYGNFPALRGSYELWRDFIEDAVRENAAPSKELIAANEMLAAWEVYHSIGKVSSFPVSLSVNITDVCNARCNFCAYLPERVSDQKLSLDQFKRADWLKFSRSFRPNGGGLGEPFAHPKIAEILANLQATAPFLSIGSVTNGSIMRDHVVEIIANNFSYLYVSMNAARKETYEWTMAPLKWDRFLDNMSRLREAKSKAGREAPWLRAGYVVHKHNLEELPELPETLKNLGFRDLNVNPMVPPPQFGRDQLLTAEASIYRTPELADRVFRDLENECAKHGIALSKKLPQINELLGGSHSDEKVDERVNETQNGSSAIHIVSQPSDTDYDVNFESVSEPVITNLRNTASPNLQNQNKRDLQYPEMAQISGPYLSDLNLDDDSFMPGSKHNITGEHSYEWSMFSQNGLRPICWAPWRALKVDIFNRTLVCCNFFRKLPEFKWTTAKEFHLESNMWNHPYMQHLRSKMGKSDEVPFCTFCKDANKRHLKNDEIKRDMMAKSQRTYYEILIENSGVKLTGNIDRIDQPLKDWSIPQKSIGAPALSPFGQEKTFYRNILFQHGFFNAGRVLMLSRAPIQWLPFLAEVNEQLTVTCVNEPQIQRCQLVLSALGLTNTNFSLLDKNVVESVPCKLFDAIWLDGSLFEYFERDYLLKHVRAKLRKNGRMRVVRARGMGQLVAQAMDQQDDAEAIIEKLAVGPSYGGLKSYFTQGSVLSQIRRFGFDTDKTNPPSGLPLLKHQRGYSFVARSHSVYAKDLGEIATRKETFPDDYLAGLDRFVSFTAIAV